MRVSLSSFMSNVFVFFLLWAPALQAYDCNWGSYHDFTADGWSDARCTSKMSALSAAQSAIASYTVVGELLQGLGIVSLIYDVWSVVSHGAIADWEGYHVKAKLVTGTGCRHCWASWACTTTPNEHMVCVAKRPRGYREDAPRNTPVRILQARWNKALNLQAHANHDAGLPNVWNPTVHHDQIWYLEDRGSGHFWIKNPHYGKCLNLQAHQNHNNGRPNVWTCTSHHDQYWQYDHPRGQIRHAHYGKCLYLADHENRNGGAVSVADCGGHPNQHWVVLGSGHW